MGDAGESRHGRPAAFSTVHWRILHDTASVKRRRTQDTIGGLHPLAAASVKAKA